ncbi:GNAT family N-acetyltransferase [Erythrobacter sp. SDW2]|uniref:GNAT family N-acetyltransferase n=1 Tax=Erythrobacter sp. SDW2 TaxID=2907154 RepID=UPI001F3BC722|nr:GNAT family N-acetyltransferase [Erythrobacter sp. SDW2]UIP07672.1 GNAT family N-acetyltransferase [Erythrobacter sp. SDW2]
MTALPTPIHFTLGSRRLLSVPRRLVPLVFSLEDVLHARMRSPPIGEEQSDGLRVLSAPLSMVDEIARRFPDHVIGGRQDYRRYYIDMAGGYDEYLGRFSGKTRSTLRRKQRRLADEIGGTLGVTEHRTPAEVEAFLEQALPLSALTYQARLLDAGLPDDPASHHTMLERAEQGRMRCFLLKARGHAIAYLALPVEGETLVYAHLGYHPDWARLSPGTVLQMEALERLFAEQCVRWFDFTEGEGAHKAMFGTDHVECASFLLLKGDAFNRLLLGSLAAFDGSVAAAKAFAEKSGTLARARKLLRS